MVSIYTHHDGNYRRWLRRDKSRTAVSVRFTAAYTCFLDDFIKKTYLFTRLLVNLYVNFHRRAAEDALSCGHRFLPGDGLNGAELKCQAGVSCTFIFSRGVSRRGAVVVRLLYCFVHNVSGQKPRELFSHSVVASTAHQR